MDHSRCDLARQDSPSLMLCIVYAPLSVVGPLGEHPTCELAPDRVCVMMEEGEGGSHLFPQEAGPFGLLVRRTPPLPLPPVFPRRCSPPARLTDRQMLSAVHLQLWASITPHKQPIARTQAANSVCLSRSR